jgi:capsular polysaccharide biosynthesis protein
MAVATPEKTSNFPANGHGGPRLTVVQAVQRNLLLFLAPIVILAGAAFAYAKVRDPVYSSDAQLNVGGVNLTTQTIPGYTVAVAQLAVAYARSVDATPVLNSVSKRAGISPLEAAQQMSATPVEQTPVVRIHATGSTPQQAQVVANATADALVRYAVSLNRANPDTPRLLNRFVADSRRLRVATVAVSNAKSAAARDRAQTAADVALLQQRTDAALYGQSVAGDAATSLVQKLAPASLPQSDRTSVFQRLFLGAILAGALIGVGLALARAHSQSRLRLVRP